MRGGFSEDVFLMCRRSVKWHEEERMARCLILTLINFSVLSQSPQLHPNFSFYRKGSGPWWRRGFGGSGECGDIERVRKEQSKLWIFPELSFGTESIKILIIKSQTFIFKNKPRLLFCFVICLGAFFFFFNHWQDCSFLECYWFLLLITKAMCPTKSAQRRALWPGWYPSLREAQHSSIRLRQACRNLAFSPGASALGRGGAAERRAGPLGCLPKYHKHLE